jgi:hypothetical protein
LAEFERPLKINMLEDLRHIVLAGPNSTTHLVFDEFDSTQVKNMEVMINLLDCDEWHTIPGRYSDIRIPPLPRLFLTNKSMTWPFDHLFPSGTNIEQQNAILRRYTVHFIPDAIWTAAE